MERFYAHDGPHVINKICGLNRLSFKSHGGFPKTHVMDAPHEEMADVSSRFLCENRKPLGGKADGKPERGNGLIEAAIEILKTLSTIMKGRLPHPGYRERPPALHMAWNPHRISANVPMATANVPISKPTRNSQSPGVARVADLLV